MNIIMANIRIISQNKKASFEYFLLDKFEAGLKLKGTEIKSIRQNKCNINDCYVIFKNSKPYVLNMFVAKYENGNIFNHDELRTRELLLNKSEINKLQTRIKLEGLTIVATKLYFKDSLVKLEIALAKGKKLADKREAIKERDTKRNIEKIIKNSYK